ncbi:PaaI family thioesterase [Cognatishimia sp. SS12]|uniref:PaaI family thioesterase n=1 Tax=Cognatishimia sp. SS12 TaxID=2979465 RepID=UPI0023303E76|nr:PaaI family thioesterase [Cognatishimia sp. SS12]MDC0736731.1 PaaI family thioesterase [Cognatishimia sp. SS12]
MTAENAKQAQQFIEMIPHAKALGMEITQIGDGMTQIEMDYDTRFIGDPETQVISGGAVSALMDTCCGAAVMSHPKVVGATATIDLRIDYMRGATPGQRIRARAEVYHLTRTVAFVRAVSFDDDAENPVASAKGAFTVEQSE